MGTAELVRTQLDALDCWIAELSENFDEDLNRIVPFGYSPDLEAALDLYGVNDPHAAWVIFCERADALTGLLDRLTAGAPAR